MTRRNLTDSARWFNDATAQQFDERTNWDGNNHISVATGSQWEHQRLYYTAGGRWILNSWSQWQGTAESYEEIDEAAAIDWIITQECDTDSLPDSVRERIDAGVADAEL